MRRWLPLRDGDGPQRPWARDNRRQQRQTAGCSPWVATVLVLWCALCVAVAWVQLTRRRSFGAEAAVLAPPLKLAGSLPRRVKTEPKRLPPGRPADVCEEGGCVDGRWVTVDDGRGRSAGEGEWGVEPSTAWTAGSARRRIRDAFLHAWDAYKRHAWGRDELRPLSGTFRTFMGMDMGLTVVDAMDTAVLMGLREEYKMARAWVAEGLDFDAVNGTTSFFEVTIRYLGGLLSAYYLTGDELFLSKAEDLGDRLAAAFDTPTGLPAQWVSLKDGRVRLESTVVLAVAGSCQLEMAALSRLTGNGTYTQLAEAAQDVVLSARDYNGLRQTKLTGKNLTQGGGYTVGGLADSWYEYLLKRHLQARALGEGEEVVGKYGEAYAAAAIGISEELVARTGHGWTFLASLTHRKAPVRKMEHLACFAAGMLALGTTTGVHGNRTEEMMELALELTRTCYAFYKTSRTGLSPEMMVFPADPARDFAYPAKRNGSVERQSKLRPETVESLFVLYRLTGDPKYRQWGMDIFDAWEQYARIEEGGYSTLGDAALPESFMDEQESFFLAESLKYLYLLFADSDVLPLEGWVFNTEAHAFSLDTEWSPAAGKRKLEQLMSQDSF